MTKVGIINVTGYAGVELARILSRHPDVELTSVTGRSAAGERLEDYFPHLVGSDLVIGETLDDVDLAFSALPHKASAESCIPLLKAGKKVVDISADFRLKDSKVYEEWYGVEHPAPELLSDAVYGLTERHRSQIASADLVANPGCYPTSAILALTPAVAAGIIGPDIIIDAKSGVSGAGRGLGLMYHYSEANENLLAYKTDGHRHLPEIIQELKEANSGFEPQITFLTHLIPMTRGIFSSCYAPLDESKIKGDEAGRAQIRSIYEEFYKGEPFVKVVSAPPQTKQTWGNNYCLIYPTTDPRTNRLMVFGLLDNLVKGAAGQAVQNMNLMLGLPETTGLEAAPVYP
jgi:N-acetyl-gamma-glutamyl-phosphate reductase